ncbi:baculoviral IAP repeat-containing protein 7-A-like isoform X1 [Mercenaria mercenaria]|uniref:baculoviral IAP repeat-containing protein 7-A-like isoform X1 n=1 Tax=Mercenaria mercenaria TaxID=6596 RepID=UPI00234F1EE7|nr:baculoviral IAP repeat-containing protein 7-A-like isoform X1 [Mercenaria mercenaria]
MSENFSNTVVSQPHEPDVRRPPPIALGINVEKPKFPQYAVYAKRMESFDAWPEYLPVRKADLVEAGLVYTGVGDSVRCFFCGGGLRNWEQDDVPMEEHAKCYPKCPHILLVKGQAYVEKLGRGEKTEEVQTDSVIAGPYYLESVAAQSCIEMDYPKEMVQKAIDIFIDRYANSDFKARDLCEILIDLEEQPNHVESVAAQSCIQMGYSRKMVQRAIDKFIYRYGNSYFKGRDLCEILLELEEEPTKSSPYVSDAVNGSRRHIRNVSEEFENRDMQTAGGEPKEDSSSVQTNAAMEGPNHLGSVAAQSCIEMDFSKEMVQKAIDKYINRYGNSDFKGEDLCKILFELEEELTESSPCVSDNVDCRRHIPTVD